VTNNFVYAILDVINSKPLIHKFNQNCRLGYFLLVWSILNLLLFLESLFCSLHCFLSKQGNRSVQGSSSYASANSQLQNKNWSLVKKNFETLTISFFLSFILTLDNASLGASQRLGSSSDTHSTHRTAFYRFDHLSSFKVLYSACRNEVWIISEVWHETGT
jgi:hypothetical protein